MAFEAGGGASGRSSVCAGASDALLRGRFIGETAATIVIFAVVPTLVIQAFKTVEREYAVEPWKIIKYLQIRGVPEATFGTFPFSGAM